MGPDYIELTIDLAYQDKFHCEYQLVVTPE